MMYNVCIIGVCFTEVIHMTTKLERISIYFPKPLLDDLRKYVPPRKRSAVIVEAMEKEVQKLKLLAALEESFGAWSDEDHPELATDEDIDRYVHDLRATWRPAEQEEDENKNA